MKKPDSELIIRGTNPDIELLKTYLKGDDRYTITLPTQQTPHPFIQMGGTNYPEFLISRHNIGFQQGYDDKLEQAAQKLGLNLANKRNHLDGVGFIGNINKNQALSLNEALGNFTIPIIYFKDHLTNLISGINREKTIYDQDGVSIDPNILQSTYEDITKQVNPCRAQWFNDMFEGIKGQLHHIYTAFVDGQLQQVKEPLEDCLMQDKQIDINYWLNNATSQGLPPANTPDGNVLYFWYPRRDAVARFDASSNGVFLDCDASPRGSDPRLGVRAARLK